MKRARDDDGSPAAPPARGGLEQRVILITGAGGGIGRAAALELAGRGARLFLADSDAASLKESERLALEVTEHVRARPTDVSDEDAVKAMVADAVAAYGRLDGAVNAAGIEGERGPLHEMSLANWDRVMGVNLRGIFLCMRAEIAQMLAQADAPLAPPAPRRRATALPCSAAAADAQVDARNYGVVNVGSSAGLGSMPEFSAYCASKFAINGLTRTAAKEYAAKGIRVNAVCPSTTDTPMVQRFTDQWPDWQAKQNASFPSGRVGRVEEVASACAFLLSDECRHMSGTCLTIDGALSA